MDIFSQVRYSLHEMGLIKEVFTFVDSSQLISKLTNWDDRDKAIKQGLLQFNNKTAGKVAADKQARFGSKSPKKYWYGYKEHASVDMQSGLINETIVATVGNAAEFKNGRQFAAWFGLVPRQHSSGGKQGIAWHQQTWRRVSAYFIDSWNASRHTFFREKN